MATPSNVTAAVVPGNIEFSDGGMAVDWLTGAFVKSVTTSGLATVQLANGSEVTVQIAGGGVDVAQFARQGDTSVIPPGKIGALTPTVGSALRIGSNNGVPFSFWVPDVAHSFRGVGPDVPTTTTLPDSTLGQWFIRQPTNGTTLAFYECTGTVDNKVWTLQHTFSAAAGATLHNGTGEPDSTLGANGDYYFRRSNPPELWLRVNNVWGLIITWPTGGGGGGNTFRDGSGDPADSLGADGDYYFQKVNPAVIWRKDSGSWTSIYTFASGGGGGLTTVAVATGLDGDGTSGNPIALSIDELPTQGSLNDADAMLVSDDTTNVQRISTIAALRGFMVSQARVYERVKAILKQGQDISLMPDDSNNELRISNSLTTAAVQALIDADGKNVYLGQLASYSTADNTISITTEKLPEIGDEVYFQMPSNVAGDTDTDPVMLRARAGMSGTYETALNLTDVDGNTHQPSGFTNSRIYACIKIAGDYRLLNPLIESVEEIQDLVAAMFTSNAQFTYDDNDGEIDFTPTARRSLEELQDEVAAMFTHNHGFTYDDTDGELDYTPPTQRTLEQLQDAVAAMFTNNTEFSYDDSDGTLELTLPTPATSGNSWVLRFFRPGSDPSKIIAERRGLINTNGRFVPWTGLVNYVGQGNNDWTISVANAADFTSAFSNDLRFGGAVSYDNLTNKPITRISSDAALPTATAATLGRRYQTNHGHQWVGSEFVIAGDDRVLNFSLFPTDTTSTSGFRFQGSVNHFSDLPQNIVTADEGKWWFLRSTINRGESPFIVVNAQGGFQNIAHSPETDHPYQGAWDAEGSAEASHEFTAAGQLAVFPDSNGAYQVYVVDSDFVAGTPDTHLYHWTRSDVHDLLLTRIDNLEADVTKVANVTAFNRYTQAQWDALTPKPAAGIISFVRA